MEWKTIKWLNLSKNKVSYTKGQKKSYSYMLTFATIILWLEFYATIKSTWICSVVCYLP